MLIAARNSQDFACCARATVSARSKYAPACDEPSCGNFSAISPVTRWISASYQRSFVVSTAAIASPMHPKCPHSVYDSTKRFQAGWVGPMRILEDHQHRLLPRQRLYLRGKRLKRFLPALLRCQFEGGIPTIVRQREHLGKERCVLDRARSLREQSIELAEFLPERIVV